MKKIAPIVVIVLLALTSCKKEWDCECTTTVSGTTTTSSIKTAKISKKNAKTACEALSSTSTTFGTSTCKIK